MGSANLSNAEFETSALAEGPDQPVDTVLDDGVLAIAMQSPSGLPRRQASLRRTGVVLPANRSCRS